jgi:hypothetical protein
VFFHSSATNRVSGDTKGVDDILGISRPAQSHWSPPNGASIGHYEGDTLIVDTVGIKVAPLSTVDRYGTPHTEALHVVERYRLVDQALTNAEPLRAGGFQGGTDDAIDRSFRGKVLRVDFTVDDPGTFNMPWSGAVVYNRAKGLFVEDVCAENIHDYIMNRDSAVPTAKTDSIAGG